jgi:S1-C subfamily serine protease
MLTSARASIGRALSLATLLLLSSAAVAQGQPSGSGSGAAAPRSGPPGETGLRIDSIDRATARVLTVEGPFARLVRGTSLKQWMGFARTGLGSGVAVTGDGLIATADHVVRDALAVYVRLPGSPQVFPAAVVHRDPARDFAFLSINATTPAWIPIPEQTAQLAARQRVHAVGYPLDPSRTLPQSSEGIIAGVTPEGLLQLSIAVNPGNSGGPLIGDQNQLLGIIVARGNPIVVQGVALAVPIASLSAHYKNLAATHRQSRKSPDLQAAALLLEASTALGGGVPLVHPERDRLFLRSDAWQAMSQLDSSRIGERLEKVRTGEPSVDAIAATLASVYRWNWSALLREHRDPRWEAARKESALRAHWAAGQDQKLLRTSSFVRLARRRAVVDYGKR